MEASCCLSVFFLACLSFFRPSAFLLVSLVVLLCLSASAGFPFCLQERSWTLFLNLWGALVGRAGLNAQVRCRSQAPGKFPAVPPPVREMELLMPEKLKNII